LPEPQPAHAADAIVDRSPPAEAATPIYHRWWFWAGAGVAVLGTVAGIYAGAHSGSATSATTMMAPPVMGSAGTFDTRGRH
jgi:hypothetical protein